MLVYGYTAEYAPRTRKRWMPKLLAGIVMVKGVATCKTLLTPPTSSFASPKLPLSFKSTHTPYAAALAEILFIVAVKELLDEVLPCNLIWVGLPV